MNKVIIFGLILLCLSGCSTPASKVAQNVSPPYSDIDHETLKEWAKPFEHIPASRVPSSEMVSRPVYFWEADTLKIPLNAGDSVNQYFNVKFNQYSSYEMKETVEKIIPRVVTRWVEGSSAIIVCSPKEGIGRSKYWNAFYSAPASQKAQALADAIDGIGNASAKALIQADYFRLKPRSWEDFEREILRAYRNNVINQLVEYQILYKFRQENMTKLGYNTQSSGDCSLVVQTYVYPQEVVVNEKVKVEVIVPHRDLISSETRQFHFEISGQKLQSFEQEMLIFSFNHDTNQVTLAPAAYNNYSVSFDGQNIKVEGASRKNINLPDDVLIRGATLETSNGVASFTAPINKKYMPKNASQGYLFVSVEVYSCDRGMFGCSVLHRNERKEVPAVIQPNLATGLVNYKFPISPGRKFWVRYWVNMASSPWYTNNVVISPDRPEI